MIEIDIQVRRGEFTLTVAYKSERTGVLGIYGPSGSGKSTLLRALAGLEVEATGLIRINGENWLDGKRALSTHRRGAAVVFQEPSLLPHLSVEGNLNYAQKRAQNNLPNREALLDVLAIRELLDRRTHELSGGQAQRVAIARALFSNPRMLLLDEPVSAIDLEGRRKLFSYLEKLFQQINIPVFYVSHSPEELALLADNLLVLEHGRLIATGTLREIAGHLGRAVAHSGEEFSILEGRVERSPWRGLVAVQLDGGERLYVPGDASNFPGRVRLQVFASDVSVALERPNKTSIINIIPASIISVSDMKEGFKRTLSLSMRSDTLMATVSEHSFDELALIPGTPVFAQVKSVALLR